jgi:hypothetical protein
MKYGNVHKKHLRSTITHMFVILHLAQYNIYMVDRAVW